MATATQVKPKAVKVFEGLRCPHCGEADCLDIKVESLLVECRDCGESITRTEVEAVMARWMRLFGWIDMAATNMDF